MVITVEKTVDSDKGNVHGEQTLALEQYVPERIQLPASREERKEEVVGDGPQVPETSALRAQS